MKIIPENEVDGAAESFAVTKSSSRYLIDTHKRDFKAGVTFTESKVHEYIKDIIIENQGLKLYKDNEARRFEELAIEFLDSIKEYERENGQRICFDERDSKELFKLFLKERNKKE